MTVLMPPESGNFEQPPDGFAGVGVCIRVLDLGTQRNEYQGDVSYKRQLLIMWELPEARMADGRPFAVSNWYTFSSHPKSNLRIDLESWRGKAFGKGEIEQFDVSKLLGKACMLGLIHNDAGRARVKTIMRLPHGMTAPAPENECYSFSLADRPFDHVGFGKLSERMQERIKLSPEYKAAVAGRDPNEEPPPARESDYGALDDAIPF